MSEKKTHPTGELCNYSILGKGLRSNVKENIPFSVQPQTIHIRFICSKNRFTCTFDMAKLVHIDGMFSHIDYNLYKFILHTLILTQQKKHFYFYFPFQFIMILFDGKKGKKWVTYSRREKKNNHLNKIAICKQPSSS